MASEGGDPVKKGDGSVKRFKQDAMACKEKWGSEVRVTQPKQGVPGFPFPIAVSREVPRPAAAKAWEVWEIKAKLFLDGKPVAGEDPPIHVDITVDVILPDPVKEAMQDMLLKEWKRRLSKRAEGKVDWYLEETLSWVESHYMELLSAVPVYVNRFIAVSEQGMNEWHYTILEPSAPPAKAEEEDEPELTEEQIQNELARRQREIEAQQRAEEERRQWAEERRRLAELEGPKPKQMSKKEVDQMKAAKRGQGDRTAKTGPRRRKFNADGSEEA